MRTLTPAQAAHVAQVHPECRVEMAEYLSAGTDVVIGRQNDCGSDVPAYAIAVAARQDFWIDCCDTPEEAKALARSLGLTVVA
ncbi:hypothetical protein [Cupriavidus sp. TMH.W2]|uniref:hypothetical protein n=1 Tax=Cupriavidus sp. TMH.W2 TaxID=3434465 RepID=UPI003D76FE03